MANVIKQKAGTGTPVSGMVKSELAIKHVAAAHTTAASSMLYIGEDAGDDGVTIRALGTGLTGDSGQGGAEIGKTMTFSGGTDITTSVSGSTVTITSSAGGGSGDITAVVAGTGMTGGASSGSATVNVIGGTGITANADDIAIDSTVVTKTGTQTLTNKTIAISGNLTGSGRINLSRAHSSNDVCRLTGTDNTGQAILDIRSTNHSVSADTIIRMVNEDASGNVRTWMYGIEGGDDDFYFHTGTDATKAVTPDGLDGWTGSAQVTIEANTAQTINKTAGAIEIAFTASRATASTPNYRTAHLICVEANTWAMTISDYGPTS
jgi:hypothetical protein